jgi:geranylgeranyl diphosphate synthase type I
VSFAEISRIRDEINNELAQFASSKKTLLEEMDSALSPVGQAMESFILESGKRLRPLFAYLGFAGTGLKPSKEILRACTALELVHVCALIHDDVMDGSDTRRNKPSIHRGFESLHQEQQYSGNPEKFGTSAAILLGDLALVWGDDLLRESGVDSETLYRALPIFNHMREELMAGQYLDVLEGGLATRNLQRSLKIARYKSGKYSIERPLHFGATLAQEGCALMQTYSDYGLPLGEAFQLRDDLLGVFGNPLETGKPAGDDLREGKRTVLIAMTYENINVVERQFLDSKLGKTQLTKEEIGELQEVITRSGAVERCENLINKLRDQALLALQTPLLEERIAQELSSMAILATQRSL